MQSVNVNDKYRQSYAFSPLNVLIAMKICNMTRAEPHARSSALIANYHLKVLVSWSLGCDIMCIIHCKYLHKALKKTAMSCAVN